LVVCIRDRIIDHAKIGKSGLNSNSGVDVDRDARGVPVTGTKSLEAKNTNNLGSERPAREDKPALNK
jgi:hypothetical protein